MFVRRSVSREIGLFFLSYLRETYQKASLWGRKKSSRNGPDRAKIELIFVGR